MRGFFSINRRVASAAAVLLRCRCDRQTEILDRHKAGGTDRQTDRQRDARPLMFLSYDQLLAALQIETGSTFNKKLSYRRVTARCVLSVVILPVATQQCRNYLYDKS